MTDLDQYLRLEANQFSQDQEVERILQYKDGKDPLLILGLPLECYITLQVPEKLLKQTFRKKSLRVHPDKNKHEKAPEAFEELQKALNQLQDPTKRRTVMNFVKDARDGILQQQGIELPKIEKDKPELLEPFMRKYPNLGRLIQLEFMRLANELEYRDRTRLKNEQIRELQRQEQEQLLQKQEQEFEKRLDESRKDRIESWHKFEKNRVKKKKKVEALGSIPKGLFRK